MKYCPNPRCPTLLELGLVAEYEDRVQTCTDCGTILIQADNPPKIEPYRTTQPESMLYSDDVVPRPRMMYCPNPKCPTIYRLGIVAEYELDVETCIDCGTTLVEADSPSDLTDVLIKSLVLDEDEPDRPRETGTKMCPNPNCPTIVKLGFQAEFSIDVQICEDCGAALVAVKPDQEYVSLPHRPPQTPAITLTDPILLETHEREHDAEHCKVALRRSDVRAQIEDEELAPDTDSAPMPETSSWNADILYHIYIDEQDVPRAIETLNRLSGRSGSVFVLGRRWRI